LVSEIEDIAGVKLERHYDLDAPRVLLDVTATTLLSNRFLNGNPIPHCEKVWRNLTPGSPNNTPIGKLVNQPQQAITKISDLTH